MRKLLFSLAALSFFTRASAQWSPSTTDPSAYIYRPGSILVGHQPLNTSNAPVTPSNPGHRFTVHPNGAGGILIGHPTTHTGGYTSLQLEVSALQNGYSSITSIKGSGQAMGDLFFNCANVGIGTSSPFTKLHVLGTLAVQDGNRGRLFFYGNDGGHLGYSVRTGAGGGWAWQLIDGNNASFFHVEYPTGNVGIGTSTPDAAYKLSVNGSIRAKEIRVNTNWADFVFRSDYRLLPLAEVESYIRLNGHLPDVPSAETVEREGVNLGEMEATLLRKVEELTLYIIEQNKKIEALQQQVAGVKR